MPFIVSCGECISIVLYADVRKLHWENFAYLVKKKKTQEKAFNS